MVKTRFLHDFKTILARFISSNFVCARDELLLYDFTVCSVFI